MKLIEYEDVIFSIGSNALDNWNILNDAKQNWFWFHLDNTSSPYVILNQSSSELKKKEKNINDYFKMGCLLCKENSKLKDSTKKVKVIYTTVKNVSKGLKVGEAIISGKVKSFLI